MDTEVPDGQEPEYSKGTEDEARHNNPKSPLKTPLPAAPPNMPCSQPSEANSYQEKSYRLNQRQLVVSKWTLVFLIIYTGINAYQACQMRKATKASKISADAATSAANTAQKALNSSDTTAAKTLTEMQKQSTAMQGAADAAKIQAETSKRTLDNGITSSRLDQRAWVVPTATSFQYLNDEQGIRRAWGRIVIQNTGHSPAFHVSGWRCAEVRNDEPIVPNESPGKDFCREINAFIGPGATVTLDSIDTKTRVEKGTLSPNTYITGRNLFIWGKLSCGTATDNRTHSTRFCLSNAGNQLGPCKAKDSNDAD